MKNLKTIDGFDDYKVTDDGRVFSYKYGKERELKPGINSSGYYSVNLCRDGKHFNKRIHVLVAQAFLNHVPNGTHQIVVNHIDNNPLNNNVINLELVTNRYNCNCHKTDPGVSWKSKNKKYLSQITFEKYIHLGYYINKSNALKVRKIADRIVISNLPAETKTILLEKIKKKYREGASKI